MDGYVVSEEEKFFMEKFLYLQSLNDNQNKIDKEISQIAAEIEKLPTLPKSIDRWVNSFSTPFKISDFDKMFSLNRRYRKLLEERKSNGSKIRIFAIENVMDQITQIEGMSK